MESQSNHCTPKQLLILEELQLGVQILWVVSEVDVDCITLLNLRFAGFNHHPSGRLEN